MAVTMVVMLIVKEMGRAEGCELLLMDGPFPDSRMLLLHTHFYLPVLRCAVLCMF